MFMIAFGALWLWMAAHDPSQGPEAMWFGAVWTLLVAVASMRFVAMPHTIEVMETGTMRFVGTFRTSSVEPAEVTSIRAVSGPFIQVRHVRGKIQVLQFTGFHEFVAELKKANPRVEIRGI